ncbi:MAG: dihydrofolate reductase family protein [Thermoplasmata archaeon]|nr:dihydrofolate reductase family protein [Thermoplasmata archaeon]
MTGGRRPKVWVNCAISLDGRLAYSEGRRALLSGPEDLARVQRLRADSDAILVGVGTVLLDDPSLKVHWDLLGIPPGREPLRVILDSQGRTPPGAKVLDGSAPTLIATAKGVSSHFKAPVEAFSAGHPTVDLPALLSHLSGRGVGQVMVEGGSKVLASFLGQRLFDVLTVFVAPVVIGDGSAPAMVAGGSAAGTEGALHLERTDAHPLDDGVLLTFRRRE